MANQRQANPGLAAPTGAPEPLRLQLLGGFRATVGDREIADRAWKLRRAAAIVKLLALTPERRLHREQVMDLLWPDLEPEAALHSLNQALYVARRVLEPTLARKQPSRYLPLQGQALVLCPDAPLDLDVAAFETAADRAQGDDPATYSTALARYTGELLPEDRYEEWASARREALHGRYQGLLLALAGLHERDGRYHEAVTALSRLVADEPTHETAHVGLMRLHALSGHRAQALRQYHQLHEILGRELAATPDPASERLYQEILAGRFPPTGAVGRAPVRSPARDAAPTDNLPAPLTSFIGRQADVAALIAALTPPARSASSSGSPARLFTLIGAGGCGKTRLALAVATELVPRYPDGVWLADLAVVTEPDLVAKVVAQALAVQEEPGRPLATTLTTTLRDRRLLLVLDNCEHLIAACAALAQTLLARCPEVRILATSRESLRVPGERPWRVPSLTLPPAALADGSAALVAAVRDSESGQLFAQRAVFHLPHFALDAVTAPAVAAICRRLDGIPLALELAAARTALLRVEEIAARLDGALALLGGGDRTAPSRQQTLRATLDWSYALLPVAEQRLLRQLAVFAGGWTLAAAEVVCAPATEHVASVAPPGEAARTAELRPVPSADTLSLLAALVEKSLVQVDLRGGAARYRLLEMVRQYAWVQLEANGEAEATQRRHAAHYVALAEPTLALWYTPQEQDQTIQLEREHDNLRAALAWGLTRPEEETAPRIAGSLWVFWFTRGSIAEARRWLDAALAHPRTRDLPLMYSQLLNGVGYVANAQGDIPGAIAAYEERLAWQRARDDRRGQISTLGNYAMLVREQLRDYQRSHDLCVEAIALAREYGPANQLPNLLNILGLTVRYLGDHARAWGLHEEALALARQGDDEHNEATSLGNLAMVAFEDGRLDEAQRLYQEGLIIIRRLGKAVHIGPVFSYLAEIASAQGRPVRAARLFGAAEALRAAQGSRLSVIIGERHERAVARLRDQLPPPAFSAAWQAGRSLSLDDALAEALEPS